MKPRWLLLGVVLTCSSVQGGEPLYAGKPLAFWLDELKSSDPLVCEEAVVVLTEAGPAARAAVPRLEALTKAEPRRLRLRAGLALWHIAKQKKPAIAALTEALRDPTTPDRLVLLRTLIQFGPDAASSASAVYELVGDDDSLLANQAVYMLPKLGPGIVPVLAAELEGKDVRRRRHASEALAQMGAFAGEARSALLRGLDADDTQVRAACARSLWVQGQSTEAVLAVLREEVRTGTNAQRRRILETVGYGNLSKRSAPLLKELMQGGELHLRIRAAQWLQDVDPQPETVLPLYVQGLKSSELGVRFQSAQGLARLGPAARPALPALIELMKAREGAILTGVQSSLVAIGAPAVPPLIELLTKGKGDPRVNTAVINVLSRIGAPAVPAVVPLLGDANAQTRDAGCRVLFVLGPAGKEAVPKLTELLKDDDFRVRRDAMTALGCIGPAARPATRALMELSHDPNLDLRTGSLKALEQIQADPKLVRPLAVKALEDKNVLIRTRAVSLLWQIAPKDVDLMPHIQELLKQPLARPEMLDLLGQMGPQAAAAVPVLTAMLAGREPGLRFQIVETLQQFGSTARPAVPALIDLLPGADISLRQSIVKALLAIGSDDSTRIVPAVLATAQKEKDATHTRFVCLRVLAQHGRKSAAAVPWLVDELNRPANFNTINVANALFEIDSVRARKEAVPVLQVMVKETSPLQLPAAGALLRLQPDKTEALQLLIEGLQATEFYKRQQAGQLLAAAGAAARAAVPALRQALHDPAALVRVYAADALYRITGETETTVPVLIEALKPSPPDNYTRQQAAEKLGDIGPVAKAALPALRELSQETDRFMRYGFQAAIRKIDPPAPSKP